MMTEGTGSFKCPRCGATTSGAMDYCGDCGMSLQKECPNCGKQWRYVFDHTFCPDGGARVEQAERAASRT